MLRDRVERGPRRALDARQALAVEGLDYWQLVARVDELTEHDKPVIERWLKAVEAEGDLSPPADSNQEKRLDPAVLYSPRQLAKASRVPMEPLRKALEAWRKANALSAGYVEVPNPKGLRNNYLYDFLTERGERV